MRSFVLFFLLAAAVSATAQIPTLVIPRKNAIYFQFDYLGKRTATANLPAGTVSPPVFLGSGFAALSYERFALLRGRGWHGGLAAGITPPINAQVRFAWHIGPKFYIGSERHAFSIDAQYCQVFSRHTRYYLPEGTYEHLRSRAICFGIGYCLTTRSGFYLNPSLIFCNDTYDRRKGAPYAGFQLASGYCF
ncbi:MAG: hypothetical protein JNM22_11510 [Saprospiraceae bacterium]|nr:hypothetical protein [Saprospiraceae bacterium]